MRISVLVTAYRRPEQLRQALASLAQQEHSLIGEILVGDDSPPACWPENQAVIAASGLTSLIEYLPSNPPRGTYGNQCFLGKRARFDHILILHDDDQLCPDALATLAAACENETEADVEVWFGRILVMDEHGQVDMARSVANDEFYGRGGASEVRPMWDWGLYEALPPNSFLISRETYNRFAYGPRDGNVGDWGLVVRLANSGAKGRFMARYLSRYRVQAASVTNTGRGVDVHRWYELLEQLRVPPEGQARKAERLQRHAMVAITRYARDGDRSSAWRCFLSAHVSWRQRLSRRGWATVGMLLTPAKWWTWVLRYRS